MRSWRNDAVLIVGGFLLGAIFIAICFGLWPDTGDENGIPVHPFWRFLWQWQTVLVGLIGGSIAVYAARAAWISVQAQITNTDRILQAQREQIIREGQLAKNATANSLMLTLLQLHGWVTKVDAINAADVTTEIVFLKESLRDVVQIDVRFAACVTFACRDLADMNERRGPMLRLEWLHTRRLAFQILLLSEAFAEAANAYSRGLKHTRPLLSREHFDRLSRAHGVKEADLDWASSLLET